MAHKKNNRLASNKNKSKAARKIFTSIKCKSNGRKKIKHENQRTMNEKTKEKKKVQNDQKVERGRIWAILKRKTIKYCIREVVQWTVENGDSLMEFFSNLIGS